jgi:predicted RNA binding protein YcfA (HicA-like mRNA interferase family)
MDKEMKIVVKAAIKRGWKLVTGGRHYVLKHPTGIKVQVSMSPSDKNAHRQLERRLRYREKEIANAHCEGNAAGGPCRSSCV